MNELNIKKEEMETNEDLKLLAEGLGIDFIPEQPKENREELEERKRKYLKEIEINGFLPPNEELKETMTSLQEVVEANPRRFIIEECIPACLELWSKNIYTFMASDHLNKGVCWIEMVADNLSDENKDIFGSLEGEDVIKFSYHSGTVNFGIKCVGLEGQKKLLELAKQFKMQDVPKNQAYITEEEFLINYCDCYEEYENPNHKFMEEPYEIDIIEPEEFVNYMEKYDKWKNSEESLPRLKKIDPNKVKKSTIEYAREHNMIYEDGRIYLSQFHYEKHQKYLQYIYDNQEKSSSHRL